MYRATTAYPLILADQSATAWITGWEAVSREEADEAMALWRAARSWAGGECE